jgi:predicted nucleic acid-binding protein
MEVLYLDTNVFLRFLTRDHPDHSKRAYALFKQVEAGTQRVTTAEIVLAEIVHVLASKALYALPRQDIKTKVSTLLALKGFRLPGKRTWHRALELYATSTLDVVDAYLVAVVEQRKQATIISFDKGFDGLPGITRQEP